MAVLNNLPVGYRFSPTDKELVNHFLRLKNNGNEDAVSCIREVDLCKLEPWDLPALSPIKTKDDKWIFFCPKDRKYKNGKRSNRATEAGYWKATGKDRSVMLGTTEIGTKKTLVFYKGRAPKGQRTHWVIHEYCATREELDGTNPGQGLFVVLKLIKKDDKKLGKKQDESTDGSDCNRVEENVSSPATVISFMPEVVVTPTISAQPAELPSSSKSCLNENSDGTTLDKFNVQPDFDPEVLRHLLYPIPEPLDFLGKINSPWNLQMQSELESLNHLYCEASNDVGPDHNGVQFPRGTNEQDVTDYLASVLDTSHEQTCKDSGNYENLAVESESRSYVNVIESVFDKGTGSYSKADAEAAQAQFDPEQFERNSERRAPVCMARTPERSFVSVASDQSFDLFNSPEGSSNAVSNGDTFETGIILRSRQRHDQPSVNNVGPQGNAPRRIRLLKLKVQSSSHSNFGDLGYKEEDHEAKLVAAKAEEAEEKHSVTADPAAIIDEMKVAQELGWNMKSVSDFPRGGDEEVPSASLKAPPALHSISSSIHMLWVLLAVGLSIVFVGLWRFLEF